MTTTDFEQPPERLQDALRRLQEARNAEERRQDEELAGQRAIAAAQQEVDEIYRANLIERYRAANAAVHALYTQAAELDAEYSALQAKLAEVTKQRRALDTDIQLARGRRSNLDDEARHLKIPRKTFDALHKELPPIERYW